MGTFAEKENTLKVFHDTKNDGWEFPEHSGDPVSRLTNISEKKAILAHGTTPACVPQAVESAIFLVHLSICSCGELPGSSKAYTGDVCARTPGTLPKHNKSIVFTHYNRNVKANARQRICEQMAQICAHTCLNMSYNDTHRL